MARSITYWYDVIITEKNTMSNLNGLLPAIDSSQKLLTDLNSKSKVARWRLWVWCVSVAAYTLDVLFDLFKIDLEDLVVRNRFGQLPWYVYIAKSYQHGYSLSWINNRYQYNAVDEAARIIKRAAAEENGEVINLKFAKVESGVTVPCNLTEKNAFKSYVEKVKPAGVDINYISEYPDDLKLFISVLYDPMVLTNSGESILTPGVFPVEDSINNFIGELTFNGTLELCFVNDSIQKSSGVVSSYVTNAQARYGANPFVAFPERYVSNAGHLAIHAGSPLNSTITYTANV